MPDDLPGAQCLLRRTLHEVDQFLGEWVQPVLDRFGADAAERLGDPDVRV